MINVRKLAAIDLHFLPHWLILTEFALGVLGPFLLGLLTLRMAHRHAWPFGLTLFAAYLFSLGLNYIPLLLHAISLVRTGTAAAEIAGELSNRPAASRKYRHQSLYLLVPLVVPIAALLQQGQKSVPPPPGESSQKRDH
jgi:hypothetical protein